ncbi:MAG: phosphoribosyl-AMP cyclohydrolase [Candidatus Omnitrophica bacterium]|nr:phosphoribosyl-AMP cyclohydrolase [Candidatus Omnitrophota bacterium]
MREPKFNEQGLVAVVVQDDATGQVLMQAYMNREAFDKTMSTGKCHYFSRSRSRLWLKGEESGHFQEVRAVYLDCDGDCVLVKVKQTGGACHEGYESCFFTQIDPKGRSARVVGKKVFDPKQVYKKI